MKKALGIIALWFLSVAIAEALLWYFFPPKNNAILTSDTVIVYKTIAAPQAADSIRTGVVVRSLPIYYAVHDTSVIADTAIIRDTVSVKVPISRKTYIGEDYRAVVSGYEASLDTIQVKTKTITNTIYQEPSRWALGVSAGYGMTAKGLQPYVGIGVTYNILQWKKKKSSRMP